MVTRCGGAGYETDRGLLA